MGFIFLENRFKVSYELFSKLSDKEKETLSWIEIHPEELEKISTPLREIRDKLFLTQPFVNELKMRHIYSSEENLINKEALVIKKEGDYYLYDGHHYFMYLNSLESLFTYRLLDFDGKS